jgi:DNA-binding MarR family transcriptional regulator
MNEEMIQQVAGRLHSSATRLLRETRAESDETALSGSRLSALSAVASRGALSLAELATLERVSAPTMSRIVEALVKEGMVTREIRDNDRRSVRIAATDAGKALLFRSRTHQVGALAARVKTLGESEKRALLRGIELLERLTHN